MNEEIRKSVLKYCFANCFEFPVIVNVVLIYFGIGLYAENVRHYLFVASLVVLLMIAFYAFVRVFKLKETPKSALVLYAIFLGYYIFGFAISFLKFGMTNAFKDCLPKTIIISGACFLIGYVGAKNEYEKEFLAWLEKGSFIVFPMAVYYAFVHWFDCMNLNWENGAYIGPLDYMEIAYLFMPYMLAHMLAFLFEGKRQIVFFKRNVPGSQFLRVMMAFVYWIAILSSGTRGAYVAFICVAVVAGTVKIFGGKDWIKASLPIAMLIFMFVLAFVWRPHGMYRMSRWDVVMDSVGKSDFKTDDVEGLQNGEEVEQYANAFETGTSEEENRQNDEENRQNDEENRQNDEVVAERSSSIELGRIDLYRLALYEFKNKPLLGRGPLGFYNKYGAYTHNCILEILADTGIVGALLYLGVIIYILFRWIFIRKKPMHEIVVILFLISYMVQLNISGCVWRSTSAVFFAVGYGAMVISDKGRIEREGSV